jgi:hypothetical protein
MAWTSEWYNEGSQRDINLAVYVLNQNEADFANQTKEVAEQRVAARDHHASRTGHEELGSLQSKIIPDKPRIAYRKSPVAYRKRAMNSEG